jgi:uncharacterized protein
MLVYERSTLAKQAVRVDERLDCADSIWEAGDALPVGGLVVTGRLSLAGEGRYYFNGHYEGEVHSECRRCLRDVTLTMADELHLLFVEAGDDVGSEDDVYLLPPDALEVDLRPALREQWLLAVPAFVLCSDDCKGLCQRCGTDLNVAACRCAVESDSRWDALRSLER